MKRLIFGLTVMVFYLVNGKAQDVDITKLKNETVALQRAIDSCANAGGGTVTIKPGVHLVSPLYMKSKVTLFLEAGSKLLATTNPDEFRVNGKFVGLINGTSLTDVTIKGPGIIDGNGAFWWKLFLDSDRKIPRPRMITFSKVKNLKFEDVTLQNSPSFHLVPSVCENVELTRVKFYSPESAPNTDGFDPSRCKNIKVTDCIFDVGDDCIAIKSGKDGDKVGSPCEDMEVVNCTFLHGHGLSIGSETSSGVRNLRVSHCRFKGTDFGIRIKSSPERGGIVENCTYTDIVMDSVARPIFIDLSYVDKHALTKSTKEPLPSDMPIVRSITITNVKATNAGKAAISLLGLEKSYLENIILRDVTISAKTGVVIKYAKGIEFTNVHVTAEKGEVYTLQNAEGKGI